MKLECDIVRDLLPLYAEHLASPASTALVEEHLQTCEACRTELSRMQLPVPVQPELQADAPLGKLKKTLWRKSIRTGLLCALSILCMVAVLFWMGTARTPATVEQAQFWTYNKKENNANLCVLEVQGEGVWLEMEEAFSWGKPSVTVHAMRYCFPRVHRAWMALVGSDASAADITVSSTQVLTVICADETRYYCDGQQVERYIVRENPDGTVEYGYGSEQIYGWGFKKG